jgi:hypothetical protein
MYVTPLFCRRLYFADAYILVSAHISVNAYILVSAHISADAYIWLAPIFC